MFGREYDVWQCLAEKRRLILEKSVFFARNKEVNIQKISEIQENGNEHRDNWEPSFSVNRCSLAFRSPLHSCCFFVANVLSQVTLQKTVIDTRKGAVVFAPSVRNRVSHLADTFFLTNVVSNDNLSTAVAYFRNH